MDYYNLVPLPLDKALKAPLSNIIISINEENNSLEPKSINNSVNKIIPIKQFLDEKEKYGFNSPHNDKCKIHNSFYISFCFSCNVHLCDECLNNRKHFSHTKCNIIEICPLEEELKTISYIKKHYVEKIKNINKIIKYKMEKDTIKDSLSEIKEQDLEKKKFLLDISEIKEFNMNEICLRKIQFENQKNKIINKYKIQKEKDDIIYKYKCSKLVETIKNLVSNITPGNDESEEDEEHWDEESESENEEMTKKKSNLKSKKKNKNQGEFIKLYNNALDKIDCKIIEREGIDRANEEKRKKVEILEKTELNNNYNNYILDINEIIKKIIKEIKIRNFKFLRDINEIQNRYRYQKQKNKIISMFNNKGKSLDIFNCIIKLIEIICDQYKNNKNNYYNSINVHNILLSFSNNYHIRDEIIYKTLGEKKFDILLNIQKERQIIEKTIRKSNEEKGKNKFKEERGIQIQIGDMKNNQFPYNIIKKVGETKYGKIFLILYDKNKTGQNSLCLLNKLKINKRKNKDNLIINELKNLKLIKSKYFVKIYDCFIEKEENQHIIFSIISEYIEKGNLSNNNIIQSLNKKEIYNYFFQMMFGSISLMLNNIKLKYITPKDILIDKENNIKYGISNSILDLIINKDKYYKFFSKMEDVNDFYNYMDNENDDEDEIDDNKNLEILPYICPEIISLKNKTNINDKKYANWSLGCILYELLFKKNPFGSIDNLKLLKKNIIKIEYKIPDDCEKDFKIILEKLLCENKQRFTINEFLMEEIFIKNLIEVNLYKELIKGDMKSKYLLYN